MSDSDRRDPRKPPPLPGEGKDPPPIPADVVHVVGEAKPDASAKGAGKHATKLGLGDPPPPRPAIFPRAPDPGELSPREASIDDLLANVTEPSDKIKVSPHSEGAAAAEYATTHTLRPRYPTQPPTPSVVVDQEIVDQDPIRQKRALPTMRIDRSLLAPKPEPSSRGKLVVLGMFVLAVVVALLVIWGRLWSTGEKKRIDDERAAMSARAAATAPSAPSPIVSMVPLPPLDPPDSSVTGPAASASAGSRPAAASAPGSIARPPAAIPRPTVTAQPGGRETDYRIPRSKPAVEIP